MQIHLPDQAATTTLGKVLSAQLAPGVVVFLRGDLGAGKTTLARAMLQALGVEGRIKSPTYTLVELYAVSSLNLYHFDFYRFNDPCDWQTSGFRELFGGPGICLVEWPEKAAGFLPACDLEIQLGRAGDEPGDDDARVATLAAYSDWGRQCLSACATALQNGALPPAGSSAP